MIPHPRRLAALALILSMAGRSSFASAFEGDYVALKAPDVAAAAAFLSDALGCAPLGAADGTRQALLECGNDTVVEVTRGTLRGQQPALVVPARGDVRAWAASRHLVVQDARGTGGVLLVAPGDAGDATATR